MPTSDPKPPREPLLVSWWVRDLVIVTGFLTRSPLPVIDTGDRGLMRASWCFPLIGAAIGGGGGLLAVFSLSLGLPVFAAAIIALAGTALITGALHEDGLADLADGFGGGQNKSGKIKIMRDSRIGAYGVLALILTTGLKAAAVAALLGSADMTTVVIGLIVAHAGARALIPPVTLMLDNASESGLGGTAGKPRVSTVQTALAIGGALLVILVPFSTALVVAATGCVAAAAVAALAQRQIGGYTGDVLGAIEQVAETTMLLALAATIGAQPLT